MIHEVGGKSGDGWILEAKEERVSISGTVHECPAKMKYVCWIRKPGQSFPIPLWELLQPGLSSAGRELEESPLLNMASLKGKLKILIIAQPDHPLRCSEWIRPTQELRGSIHTVLLFILKPTLSMCNLHKYTHFKCVVW